ncbi:MAG: YkgJ family cysteine cluster protein, partial [Pseudomonadales bacterium]
MDKFWLNTAIEDMSDQQWESLCDGCGKCCLQKIIDDEAPLMYHTSVACEYLDLKTCRCQVYEQRQEKVPDCTKVSAANVADF